MAIELNSNLSSMRTLRALGNATAQLSRSYERLSSGLRIVRASDDAAGLAISSSLGVENRVLTRARLNINDANSALQIADGSAGEISNILSRMSELAEQAANGTLGFAQRKRANDEYQQLGLEIRRIANTSTFNGRELLTGERVNRAHQLVANNAGAYTGLLGTSGDGSKIYSSVNTTNQLVQYDTATGQNKVIESGGTLEFYTQSVTSGGDIIYVKNGVLTRYNADSGTKDALTAKPAGLIEAALSADGRTFVYGTVNAGLFSAYAYDIESGTTKTLHSGVAGYPPSALRVSADGTKAILQSQANLTGQNGSNVNQVFSFDLSSATPTATQVTRFTSSAVSITSEVANDGTVYAMTGLSWNGGDSVNKDFLYRISSNGSTETLASVTVAAHNHVGMTLSHDGKLITFLSTNRWTGEATNSSEQAFRYDVDAASMEQLTQMNPGGALDYGQLVFSADGNRVSYVDSAGEALTTLDISLGADSVSMEVGQGNRGGISVALAAINGTLKGLGGMTLTSASSARAALNNVRENIQQLAKLRGVYGAAGSRLDVANSVLSSQVLNGEAARSQIMDADIAQEAATLVRTQILQQSAAALLAQANQQPALALRLLGR